MVEPQAGAERLSTAEPERLCLLKNLKGLGRLHVSPSNFAEGLAPP